MKKVFIFVLLALVLTPMLHTMGSAPDADNILQDDDSRLASTDSQEVRGTTYTVTNTDDSGSGSLRQAILDANANPGADEIDATGVSGTILLASGALPEIVDDLTITGPGAETLAISGLNAHRVFSVGSGANVTISALTVRNGYTEWGGGGVAIWGESIVTLNALRVLSSTADYGGGVFAGGSTVTINESQISSNTATWGAGVFSQATWDADLGEYILDESTTTINTSLIVDNVSTDRGGALELLGNKMIVRQSCILDNSDIAVTNAYDIVSGSLDAAYNWWGALDGPAGEGAGSGDSVGTNVVYSPWLTEPADACAGHLSINYNTGQPGSFFTLTGSDFPPNCTGIITVNSNTFTETVAVDGFGGFVFTLGTSEADLGRYFVTVAVNPEATASFMLDSSAPFRPQEGSGAILNVPSGIALTEFVYLPLVQKW